MARPAASRGCCHGWGRSRHQRNSEGGREGLRLQQAGLAAAAASDRRCVRLVCGGGGVRERGGSPAASSPLPRRTTCNGSGWGHLPPPWVLLAWRAPLLAAAGSHRRQRFGPCAPPYFVTLLPVNALFFPSFSCGTSCPSLDCVERTTGGCSCSRLVLSLPPL